MKRIAFALSVMLVCAAPVYAASSSAVDPVAEVVLALAVILVVAKFGGHLATKLHQPPVLGELVAGVLVGNLALVGFHGLDFIKSDAAVDMLARIGVILLLFQVGLESTIGQMLKVGLSSFLVALFGVIGPFLLGWAVAAWLIPDETTYAHAFVGAVLTATSVGITARVLKDLGRSGSDEARIILGAAVIDDVMGLVILAVMTGLLAAENTGTHLSYIAVAWILFKASAFLIGSLVAGYYASPRLFRFASRLQTQGVLLAVGLSFCFVLAWLSSLIGLAPIVGAFAAGLILEDLHYRDFVQRGENTLEHLMEPITTFLVPVFFVVMGARTDLRSFADSSVILLAIALILAAIIGKQLSMFGVLGKHLNRLAVGLGMIPRGEVGLIFANIGLTLSVGSIPVLDQKVFAAVVVMVIVTTLITPPALKWGFVHSGQAGLSNRRAPARVRSE